MEVVVLNRSSTNEAERDYREHERAMHCSVFTKKKAVVFHCNHQYERLVNWTSIL
jgi:hypothetical protein